jgi:hypothetical protein
MTTALYMLRCIQVGIRLSDLDALEYGMIMDILTETSNDEFKYKEVASQEDFDRF